MESLVAQTRKVISDKGYEVVYAEPVGVGYGCRNWLLWYEPIDEKEGNILTRITTNAPLFVYPVCAENKPLFNAVNNLIHRLEVSLSKRKRGAYEPSAEDLRVIGQETGADTIILNRVYGRKYSTRRKIGEGIFSAFFGTPSAHDVTGSHIVVMSAKTGEVLWQRALYLPIDPLAPPPNFMAQVLELLPSKGSTFDQKACKRTKGEKVQCK
ncbi:MAG: hypothetical protein JRJ83_14505 [Deltaproteobacteria bacterium]|nr:hypothetical protein [Deltaproteobacteria bacterium]